MNFTNHNTLTNEGFLGFKTIQELALKSTQIPAIKGIYIILYSGSSSPNFLTKGSGGFFKKKDPNVDLQILNSNWNINTQIIYIGKAGAENSKATLRSRLNQYLKFGQGKNIGHWGGRYIWQLEKSKDLIVCWKPLPNDDPRAVETKLISDFIKQYGKRPFANLAN